ncbi:PREDICTED: uncharacterized protein LOC109487370 [Branchiostoma belcheri]|uniref:Uncharacterized protein LOC109487370 n=1 Tax=Branchiostoma belcheri TaxID=7741 RepID=A0A6P5A0P9_BRABE|nr:PREDICTED: uncharacterized protein LOC109487370 [Branchiostoma belcheri]XP_019646906.1 PREDICTED: uncharacterized protein LOC109487370 [Branchiostoma belcheri]KAI8498635.1 hypothetical protein Bbelb_238370 [Branchiostoma belcheri]
MSSSEDLRVKQIMAITLKTAKAGMARLRGADFAPTIGLGLNKAGFKAVLLTSIPSNVSVISEYEIRTVRHKIGDAYEYKVDYADILIHPKVEKDGYGSTSDDPLSSEEDTTRDSPKNDSLGLQSPSGPGLTRELVLDEPKPKPIRTESSDDGDEEIEKAVAPVLIPPSIQIEENRLPTIQLLDVPWAIVIHISYIPAGFARLGFDPPPGHINRDTGKRFGPPNYSDRSYLQANAETLTQMSPKELMEVEFQDQKRGIIKVKDKRNMTFEKAVSHARKLRVAKEIPVYAFAVVGIGPKLAKAKWKREVARRPQDNAESS